MLNASDPAASGHSRRGTPRLGAARIVESALQVADRMVTVPVMPAADSAAWTRWGDVRGKNEWPAAVFYFR